LASKAARESEKLTSEYRCSVLPAPVMKPNQRFALLASALSCVAIGGALAAVDWRTDGRDEARSAGLRTTIEPVETRLGAPALEEQQDPEDPQDRLAYIPPEIGILLRPPEDATHSWQASVEEPKEVAANPDTWQVDVDRRNPVTAAPPNKKTEEAKPGGASRKKLHGRKRRYTLKERLAQISPGATPRLMSKFKAAKVAWPPDKVSLVAIKDRKVIELHAQSGTGKWTFIHSYPVLAASGKVGPKLRRGDRQVPEGIYRITYLNPNSQYHVSLRVNYPNAFDRKMARKEGRKDLGGDIMIHGKRTSAGCLAMGDDAAEELFVLVAEVGKSNTTLIIAPTDFRSAAAPPPGKPPPNSPEWLPELYTEVATAMSDYKVPPQPSLLSLLGLQ
jgi:hypothetical protein